MTKKEALLEAAKELFGEFGFAETTFKKISQKAGVALGLLAHHYGNKEKLFMTAGMDVLENFLAKLRSATENHATGYDAVMSFCRAYLAFSIDPQSNWLVLVRCSPYSDMKVGADQEAMYEKFSDVLRLLEGQLERGMADGSIRTMPVREAAQIIVALQVGTNRTRVLTPYAFVDQNRSPLLYEEMLRFVAQAITPGEHTSGAQS